MRVSRRFLSPFANGPTTRLRNLTRTDCDTNFGTKFGEQNIERSGGRSELKSLILGNDGEEAAVRLPRVCSGFAFEWVTGEISDCFREWPRVRNDS